MFVDDTYFVKLLHNLFKNSRHVDEFKRNSIILNILDTKYSFLFLLFSLQYYVETSVISFFGNRFIMAFFSSSIIIFKCNNNSTMCTNALLVPYRGAGRSSEIERSLMVRWVVGSILHGVDPLSYFSFQPVLHDWCNKGRGMCYPVCVMCI